MAKFVKKVLLFFALIAIIDIACGFGFNYLRSSAKGGDTQKNYYISEQCCDDILILGSSRAARHYDPQVLEDSLGMSCYNCGEPGCGIITAYARYGMIAQRHKPKLILYEVSPLYDYFKSDEYSRYLGRVRQYVDKPIVRSLFLELGDELEGLRLVSNMYNNNGFFVHNVMDNIISGNNYSGFEPLFGRLNPNKQQKPNTKELLLDSLKLSYMENFIVKLRKENVSIIFIVSPKCYSKEEIDKSSSEYDPMILLCHQYNVPFINHTYMEGISDNYSFFQDYNHLNKKGAVEYSKTISSELKKFYSIYK